MDTTALSILLIWLALTFVCWIQQAIKYRRNPPRSKGRKEVNAPKLLLLMIICSTLASSIVIAYRTIDFSLNSSELDNSMRFPLIAGGVFMVVFGSWSLIRGLKAKL
jgi:uncharacterized membrane protein YagU involved in acid resistance